MYTCIHVYVCMCTIVHVLGQPCAQNAVAVLCAFDSTENFFFGKNFSYCLQLEYTLPLLEYHCQVHAVHDTLYYYLYTAHHQAQTEPSASPLLLNKFDIIRFTKVIRVQTV